MKRSENVTVLLCFTGENPRKLKCETVWFSSWNSYRKFNEFFECWTLHSSTLRVPNNIQGKWITESGSVYHQAWCHFATRKHFKAGHNPNMGSTCHSNATYCKRNPVFNSVVCFRWNKVLYYRKLLKPIGSTVFHLSCSFNDYEGNELSFVILVENWMMKILIICRLLYLTPKFFRVIRSRRIW
jgi:hypothetical protein